MQKSESLSLKEEVKVIDEDAGKNLSSNSEQTVVVVAADAREKTANKEPKKNSAAFDPKSSAAEETGVVNIDPVATAQGDSEEEQKKRVTEAQHAEPIAAVSVAEKTLPSMPSDHDDDQSDEIEEDSAGTEEAAEEQQGEPRAKGVQSLTAASAGAADKEMRDSNLSVAMVSNNSQADVVGEIESVSAEDGEQRKKAKGKARVEAAEKKKSSGKSTGAVIDIDEDDIEGKDEKLEKNNGDAIGRGGRSGKSSSSSSSSRKKSKLNAYDEWWQSRYEKEMEEVQRAPGRRRAKPKKFGASSEDKLLFFLSPGHGEELRKSAALAARLADLDDSMLADFHRLVYNEAGRGKARLENLLSFSGIAHHTTPEIVREKLESKWSDEEIADMLDTFTLATTGTRDDLIDRLVDFLKKPLPKTLKFSKKERAAAARVETRAKPRSTVKPGKSRRKRAAVEKEDDYVDSYDEDDNSLIYEERQIRASLVYEEPQKESKKRKPASKKPKPSKKKSLSAPFVPPKKGKSSKVVGKRVRQEEAAEQERKKKQPDPSSPPSSKKTQGVAEKSSSATPQQSPKASAVGKPIRAQVLEVVDQLIDPTTTNDKKRLYEQVRHRFKLSKEEFNGKWKAIVKSRAKQLIADHLELN